MVGLSVILETRKLGGVTESTRQVIDKSTLNVMINNHNHNHHRNRNRRHCSALPSPPAFLDRCFLCRQKLLPGKDIYMYGGDKGFCSEECRCRQIFMDEEEAMLDAGNCSFAAIKPQSNATPPSSSSSPSSSPPPSRHRKASRNHAGPFAAF